VSGRDDAESAPSSARLGPRRLGGEALKTAPTPEPVSLQQVEQTLNAIRSAGACQSQAAGVRLLRRLDPEAARFSSDHLGEMRHRPEQGLVEAAIAEAFGVPIHRSSASTSSQATSARPPCGASGATCEPARSPCSTRSVHAREPRRTAVKRSSGWCRTCMTEEKYDGVRCQLHRQASRVGFSLATSKRRRRVSRAGRKRCGYVTRAVRTGKVLWPHRDGACSASSSCSGDSGASRSTGS